MHSKTSNLDDPGQRFSSHFGAMLNLLCCISLTYPHYTMYLIVIKQPLIHFYEFRMWFLWYFKYFLNQLIELLLGHATKIAVIYL